MGYQSRRRTYTSRRERTRAHLRNIRLIVIFLGIALVVLLYKNRWDIYNYFQTFFMD